MCKFHLRRGILGLMTYLHPIFEWLLLLVAINDKKQTYASTDVGGLTLTVEKNPEITFHPLYLEGDLRLSLAADTIGGNMTASTASSFRGECFFFFSCM